MERSCFAFVLLTLVGAATSQETLTGVCILQPSMPDSQNVTGTIKMTQTGPDAPVSVTGTIQVATELDVSGKHGFHIHEFGVPSGDCAEAAGHYNPFGDNHGAPDVEDRHVGDLGNIDFSKVEDGLYSSTVEISDSLATLFGEYNVIGRAIVLHEGEDDLGLGGEDDSLTTGHAGARIACCTIYVEE